MYLSVRTAVAVWLGMVGVLAATAFAQRNAAPTTVPPGSQAEVTARIVASAQALLTTLDEAGRAKVQFPFDGPQKTRWSNLPSGIFQRQGLRMGDLTPPQRAAVTTLLTVALSRDGYRKVTDIMRGDEVLRTTEQSGRGRGGPPPGRIRTAERRRSHPHHLSGPDQ